MIVSVIVVSSITAYLLNHILQLESLRPPVSHEAMGWPYHFTTLEHEEKILRRDLLNRYGTYAQLSAVIPVLVYQLYLLGLWAYSKTRRSRIDYTKVPGSKSSKLFTQSGSDSIANQWRSLQWWLDGEIHVGWGERKHWIAAIAWTAWLLLLSVHKTGDGMYILSTSPLVRVFGPVSLSQSLLK